MHTFIITTKFIYTNLPSFITSSIISSIPSSITYSSIIYNQNTILIKIPWKEAQTEHYWQREKFESSSNRQATSHLSGCGSMAVAAVTTDGLRLRSHWMLLRIVESGSEWRRRRRAVRWDWETRVGTAGTGGRGNSVQGHLLPPSRPPRAPRNQPLLPQWAYLSINCATQEKKGKKRRKKKEKRHWRSAYTLLMPNVQKWMLKEYRYIANTNWTMNCHILYHNIL